MVDGGMELESLAVVMEDGEGETETRREGEAEDKVRWPRGTLRSIRGRGRADGRAEPGDIPRRGGNLEQESGRGRRREALWH